MDKPTSDHCCRRELKREGGTSWKIDEVMEKVEEFKYLSVWFDRKLRGNVHLEKMANKAEEWVER